MMCEKKCFCSLIFLIQTSGEAKERSLVLTVFPRINAKAFICDLGLSKGGSLIEGVVGGGGLY